MNPVQQTEIVRDLDTIKEKFGFANSFCILIDKNDNAAVCVDSTFAKSYPALFTLLMSVLNSYGTHTRTTGLNIKKS